MIKIQCDKYPKENCYNLKNNWEKCVDCVHNMYKSLGHWDENQPDNFKETR